MASNNSFMAFILGAAFGAGITVLALSGRGENLVSKAKETGRKIMDSIDSLEKEEDQAAAEETAEETI